MHVVGLKSKIMGCLGLHLALTTAEVAELKSFKDDSDRLEYFQSELEDGYFSQHADLIAESDKAWDAMHRALSDGELSYTSGPYPLRLAVIGGEPIYAADDYIMSLKSPLEVKDIAAAIAKVTKEELRRGYECINPDKYGFPKSEEDFEYTWDWFTHVVTFFQTAAAQGRHVLFTASQ
jgi:hypothetical protein